MSKYELVVSSAWLFERITPSEDKFLSPKPKYEIVASEKITLGIIKTEEVIIVPIAFGKMCFAISLASLAPSVRDASTYSLLLNL